jgi:DNA-binding transcriptional regulator GbsR (MarR family)
LTTKTSNKKKELLIEKLGVHLEINDKLAPVAARILAYLILSGKKGTTFEQLVTNLCASKSTISAHLTNLQSLKRVSYITKLGDRKKYFIVNPDSVVQMIDEMISKWEEQKDLHLEILNYKKEANAHIIDDTKITFDLEFHNDYLKFIDLASTSLIHLRQNMIQKINNQN